MDTFFHFLMGFVGGFLLLKGLDLRFRVEFVLILSILASSIDLDHPLKMGVHVFHNVFLLILIPSLFLVFFYFRRRVGGFFYTTAFILMGTGNLLMDMVRGSGVPLFYPLSERMFIIPYSWSVSLPWSHSAVVMSRLSVALSIYFGLIFLVILIVRYCRSRGVMIS